MIVPTDLGWSADDAFLAHDAGEWLGDTGYTWYDEEDEPVFELMQSFYKVNSGYAVGVLWQDPNTHWSGVAIVSTDKDATYYRTRNHITPPDPNSYTRHFNRTWWLNTDYWLPGADTFYTGAFPFYRSTTTGVRNMILEILTIAGVQPYANDKVWSFMAGLSFGAASKSLPLIGDY